MSIEILSLSEAGLFPREPESLTARRKAMQIEIGIISVKLCDAERRHNEIILELVQGADLVEREAFLHRQLAETRTELSRIHEQYVRQIAETTTINSQISMAHIDPSLLIHELQPPVIDEPTIDDGLVDILA